LEKGYTMFSPSLSADSTECLRNKLAWLRSRYDTGAVAPAVLAIIRQFETELAWRENASRRRLAWERE
jgi:hypothetical protein